MWWGSLGWTENYLGTVLCLTTYQCQNQCFPEINQGSRKQAMTSVYHALKGSWDAGFTMLWKFIYNHDYDHGHGLYIFSKKVETKIYRIRISRGNNMIICVKWGKGPYLWYVKIASIRGFSRAVFYPTGDLLHWGMKSRYPTGYNQDNQLCSLSVVAVNGCQSIDEFIVTK